LLQKLYSGLADYYMGLGYVHLNFYQNLLGGVAGSNGMRWQDGQEDVLSASVRY